jgi:hypothetical protein
MSKSTATVRINDHSGTVVEPLDTESGREQNDPLILLAAVLHLEKIETQM